MIDCDIYLRENLFRDRFFQMFDNVFVENFDYDVQIANYQFCHFNRRRFFELFENNVIDDQNQFSMSLFYFFSKRVFRIKQILIESKFCFRKFSKHRKIRKRVE